MRRGKHIGSLAAVCLLSCAFFAKPQLAASAYITVGAEIPVSCLKLPDGYDHDYTIIIESENSTSPQPKSNVLEITENGTGKFEIDIDEPGTFYYRVYEEPGDDPNVRYDSNVYSVTVYVENGEGDSLYYAVSAYIVGKDAKIEGIEFRDETFIEIDSSTTGTTTTHTTHTTTHTTTHRTGTTLTETETTDRSDTQTTDRTDISETETTFSHEGTETTSPETTSAADDTTLSVSSVTAQTTTSAAAETTTAKQNLIQTIVSDVIAGDSMPIRMIRTVLLIAMAVGILMLLLKRRTADDEEEEENGGEA